jgi:ATP-binding cassette subfamily B protein
MARVKDFILMVKDFNRLFQYIEKHVGDIRRGIFTGIAGQLAAISGASLGAFLVSLAITGQGGQPLLKGIFATIIALVVFRGAMSYAEMFYAHKAAYNILAEMRMKLYQAIERVAPAFLLSRRTGDMASMLMADVEVLEWFYAHTYGACIIATAVPLIVLILLGILVHPLLPWVILPWLLLTMGVPMLFKAKTDTDSRIIRKALAEVNAEVVDGIQGLREILSFGFHDGYLKKIRVCNAVLSRAQTSLGRRMGLEDGLMNLFVSLALVSVLGVSLNLVNSGAMLRDFYPVAILSTIYLFVPVMGISRMARNFGLLQASARRVFTVLETKTRVEEKPAGAKKFLFTENHYEPQVISFENVSFRYDQELPWVIRSLSFQVDPGETVALIGRSGAGKSTCINLLLRFWDVEDGAVTLGGINIKDMTPETLRSRIAVVPQDIYLFNISVLENIRLGQPEASKEEVENAARAALAHDFISPLPQGYETCLGERGVQISGGQRQRIAIARAFLRKAPILVMDEALSNLDPENERELQAVLDRLKEGRTTLVIAHRLSTIMAADRVVVLEQGMASQIGAPANLSKIDGPFQSLVESQYRSF